MAYASNSTSTPKFNLLYHQQGVSVKFYLSPALPNHSLLIEVAYNLGFAWEGLEMRGEGDPEDSLSTQKGQFSQLFPGLHEASFKSIPLLFFDSIVTVITAFLN